MACTAKLTVAITNPETLEAMRRTIEICGDLLEDMPWREDVEELQGLSQTLVDTLILVPPSRCPNG